MKLFDQLVSGALLTSSTEVGGEGWPVNESSTNPFKGGLLSSASKGEVAPAQVHATGPASLAPTSPTRKIDHYYYYQYAYLREAMTQKPGHTRAAVRT